MHRVIEHAQFAAECLHDALQSEADAEHRNVRARRRSDAPTPGTPKSRGRPGTGRDQDQMSGAISSISSSGKPARYVTTSAPVCRA